MITLEQYADVYLAMTSAMGNAAQEQDICAPLGFSAPQWHEAKAFYTARIVDPRDAGRTAIGFSRAMKKGMPMARTIVPQGPPPPSDFAAANVKISVSELDVQVVELSNPTTRQYLVLQREFNGNQVHVELNGPGFAIYGGVHGAQLQPNELTIFFDPAGHDRMRTPKVSIRFALDWKMYAYLARKLQFVFKDKLHVAPFAMPQLVQVAGLELDNTRVTRFVSPKLRVSARTKLQNLKASGRFGDVAFPTLASTTIFDRSNPAELVLFDAARAALEATLERDLTSVIAVDVTTPESLRFYVYTSLDQQDVMDRVNDALRTLPPLPLSFDASPDAAWESYDRALGDLG